MYTTSGTAAPRLWQSGSLVEIDALPDRSGMPVDCKEAVSVAHFHRQPLLIENQGLQSSMDLFSMDLLHGYASLRAAKRLITCPKRSPFPRSTWRAPPTLLGIDLHLTAGKMRELLRALEEKQRATCDATPAVPEGRSR